MAVEPAVVEDGPREQVQTGQKSRRLIWDILHLYLRDTQEAIHSRSEAGGRLGLESLLCVGGYIHVQVREMLATDRTSGALCV